MPQKARLYLVSRFPLTAAGSFEPAVQKQLNVMRQALASEASDFEIRVVSTNTRFAVINAEGIASGYFGYQQHRDVITGPNRHTDAGVAIAEVMAAANPHQAIVFVTGQFAAAQVMKRYGSSRTLRKQSIPRGSLWHIDASGRGHHRRITLPQPIANDSAPPSRGPA